MELQWRVSKQGFHLLFVFVRLRLLTPQLVVYSLLKLQFDSNSAEISQKKKGGQPPEREDKVSLELTEEILQSMEVGMAFRDYVCVSVTLFLTCAIDCVKMSTFSYFANCELQFTQDKVISLLSVYSEVMAQKDFLKC